jgi:hypothetical protein
VETATSVSATNFRQFEQAAESINAAFGVRLATATQAATTIPLPIDLGPDLGNASDQLDQMNV